MKKRSLKLSDMKGIDYLSALNLSVDGNEIAYVVTKALEKTGEFIKKIFMLNIQKGIEREIQEPNNVNQDLPKYSPDGQWLAYLSDITGEKQIWLYHLEKETTHQLTRLRYGVIDFNWSMKSDQIAFTTKTWSNDNANFFDSLCSSERESCNSINENDSIVVEKLVYKEDESYGIVDGSYRQIGIVDIKNNDVKTLTKECIDCFLPVWSKNGKLICFFGRPYLHSKAKMSQLFLYDFDTDQLTQITNELMIQDSTEVVFMEDDNKLVFSGYHKNSDSVYVLNLFILSLVDKNVSQIDFKSSDLDGIGGFASVRTQNGHINTPLILGSEGNTLWIKGSFKGTDCIYQYQIEKKILKRITKEDVSIHSFCKPTQNHLVYIRGDVKTLAEVYMLDLSNNVEQRITYSNSWINEVNLCDPKRYVIESIDGNVKLYGFVYESMSEEKEVEKPVILYIHGGPEISYGYDFWFEAHYLASNGFNVVLCDPRGSGGYGSSFRRSGYAWGNESVEDLIFYLDSAIKEFKMSPDLVGVTGGSYGGHMTNRLIGSTKRFKAAVTQRTLCNLATSYGTGDIGFVQNDDSFTTMLNMLLGRVKSRSTTLKMVDQIETPLLILHGTSDYRCSFEQAEQLFIALKDRVPHLPVRLVAYPGENHELTRTGNIFNQIHHLNEITLWFEKYLKLKGKVCNENII